jgi:1,4-alpha-glucan branching enzyme
MLAPAHVDALLAGTHADPFSLLGVQQDASKRWFVRVLLPGATSVELLSSSGAVTPLAWHPQDVARVGFFETMLAAHPGQYQLRIQFPQQSTLVLYDAYSFGPQLNEADLFALRDGRMTNTEKMLGANALSVDGVSGVLFAVWAPNARRVSVVGDFNGWDGRRHGMRLRHAAGVWELFLPHAAIGDLYKFELHDFHGRLLPLKADPFARQAQLRPDTASVVTAALPMRALPAERAAKNARNAPISIYEVHVGSWCEGKHGGAPHWDSLAQRLPAYAADLGFTHIELMPISEFPFDGSWGYQTLGLFAPSARFGAPDGFARFVAACHACGLGVLLDWVPAHFPSDFHGLAQFDGTALFEYADPREGFHHDWNTLIYNFGRTEVRSFLISSARYWLEHFALDGLRVDAVASMLYRDYSRKHGEWVPNHLGGRENLEAISLFRAINEQLGAIPGAMSIAEESTAFPGVTAPTYAGGLGFHYKWNMGWMNDTLRYIQENPVHRRWHHDLMSFGLVYAFSENYVLPISHDEVVHGKGSMLAKMPGDHWQRFANLRAYYGFMWGHPGKKLLFMGQEFAQPTEWNHDQSLPWSLLDQAPHAGVQKLIRDLNKLYQRVPALHQRDCLASGFSWLVLDDREQSVFAWARFDDNGGASIVVCNFTPVPRYDYLLPVPAGFNAWQEVLNTDASHYGGSDCGNGSRELRVKAVAAREQAQSISLTLPPLGTLFLLPT